MTYTEGYTLIKAVLVKNGITNIYPGGLGESNSITLPYAEVTFIGGGSGIDGTVYGSTGFSYSVVIRIVEYLRATSSEDGTSESALIETKNGLRDAKARAIIYESGLHNSSFKLSFGYADKGVRKKPLITIIKGELT